MIARVGRAPVATAGIISPLAREHLLALSLTGAVGVIGNAIAARVGPAGGRRLHSPALVADGHHAEATPS